MKKKFYTLTYGLSIMFCMGLIGLASCSKDDDDPEPKANPVLSFKTQVINANEADGEIEIEVVLDQPAPAALTVELAFGGSVGDSDFGLETDEIEIAQGATSGKFSVFINADTEFEDPQNPEVLIIQLNKINGGTVDIASENQMAITIEQENGYLAQLIWPTPNVETGKIADMDLVIRYSQDGESWDNSIVGLSAATNFWPSEFVFIPTSVEGFFGLSFVYWDGNIDPLEFDVVFRKYTDGTLQTIAQGSKYDGTYTAANKNKWETEDDLEETIVEQVVVVDGGNIDPGDIIVPDAGSRMRTTPGKFLLNKNLKRIPYEGSNQQMIENYLKR